MSKRARPRDHPFKRRRRRQVAFPLLLLGVTGIDAFVTSLHHRQAEIYCQDLICAPERFKRVRDCGQRDQFSFLRAGAGQSEEGPKDRSEEGRGYRIPSDQLERLKESVDIVSVVESYGLPGFQRQGENRAKALCPFHDDHNPSMSIDSQRRLYKCFSCGAGGDVFNFVREYSALKDEPMTFYQAVRHVATEFGDPNLQLDFVSSTSKPRMSEEERKELNVKKQRLLLANAAAAAFYGKCLITVLAAGAARAHIQARGLAPTTVQTFAMGYAPDAYFRVKGEWGTGSLVHHLRDLGFKPSEIIEAGLATRTKGEQWNDTDGKRVNTKSGETQDDDLDENYNTLIDRFRNRLVVPIFDSRGANVIGFGGRILPPEEYNSDETNYKAPRYINSPESPVFEKKNVIFGQHFAAEAVAEMKKKDPTDQSGANRGSVVIVEGYMDAIALWDAGVHEVVASMGTALTTEQLGQAARTAGTRGGRIILCLDSDEAGVNAIERLCTGSMMVKTAEAYVVEILVATLPSGIKDPAEFIESKAKRNQSKAGEDFRKEVLDTAKDWTTWYLDRVLSRYDPGAIRGSPGTFADICDRVSDFLSRFPNPAERTKRAHDVAGALATTISNRSDSGDVSNALCIQLETDLVNMVARKAGVRESIERRIESVEGFSQDATKQRLAQMTKGDGASGSDDSSKLSSRALKTSQKRDPSIESFKDTNGAPKFNSKNGQSGIAHGSVDARRGERRRMRRSSNKLAKPPLTPHFSGFDFENQSDADWLNISRDKRKRRKQDLTLGTTLDGERMAKAMAARTGDDYVSGLALDELVYFNSDHYHGHQFLTQNAMDAGYSNQEVVRDTASILEHGVATLVRQDPNTLVHAAEEKLLANLVKSSRARLAIRNSLATSDATGSRCTIEWSSSDRAWLFDRLTNPHTIPKDVLADGRLQDLRDHLARMPDCPIGAFSQDHVTPTERVDFGNKSTNSEDNTMLKGSDVSVSNKLMGSSDDSHAMNIPSDSSDIEDWASSYDPSIFGDADVVGNQQDSLEDPVAAEPVHLEGELSTSNDAASPGSLDVFFASEEDLFASTYDASVSRELRTELEVQEAHATLLRASALKQLATVKEEWLAAGYVLAARLDEEDASEEDSPTLLSSKMERRSDSMIEFDSMDLDALKGYCNALATRLRDISVTAHQLDVSARRIGSRLLDYSNADGVEGRLSVAQQEELASMVDEHVDGLPENWQAPDVEGYGGRGRFHNNRDPGSGWGDEFGLDRNESFEEDMAHIIDDWGQWADDDFTWSPEGNRDAAMLSLSTENDAVDSRFDNLDLEAHFPEEDESLEDALHRLDTEWGDWDNEIVTTPSTVASSLDLNDVDFSDFNDLMRSADAESDVETEDQDGGSQDEPKSDDALDSDFDSVFE